MRRVVIATIVACIAAARPANASDHTNLEEGLPVEAADAYVVAHDSRELQGLSRFENSRDDKSKLLLDPRFEWGVIRNGQIAVHVPFMIETGKRADLGRVGIDALYNFNQETLVVPALAIGAGVDAPTGAESIDDGFDPSVRANLTKHIPGSTLRHALHANGYYQFNVRRHTDQERAGRYKFVGAYSARLSAMVMGIVDFVREERMDRGKAQNLVELGFRAQLTPLLVLSLGGGAGIGEDSPRFRVAFGLQYRPF